MTVAGLVKGENDDQVGEAGDVLQPGGAGRVDLDLAPDVGKTAGPEISAGVDGLVRFRSAIFHKP